MKSLQEAKSIAEAECTESTNKYRKTSRFAIRVIVVVIALSLRSVGLTDLITERRQMHSIWGESSSSQPVTRSKIPLASSPQSSWPKLVIPAGGRSEVVPLPIGMVIKMSGNRFKLVNVYLDGSECRFGDNCPVGPPTRGVYALNEANETNIVSYAYAHQ